MGSTNAGNGSETRGNRFDDNGRLLWQGVWKSDPSAKNAPTYERGYEGGYDAAGNLTAYSLASYDTSNNQSQFTNHYAMALQRRETYKQVATSDGGVVTGAIPGQVRNGADFNFGYQPINGNYPAPPPAATTSTAT